MPIPRAQHLGLTPSEAIALLRQAPLFAELGDAGLTALTSDFRRRELARGDVIFRQGDESRNLYVVFKGKIRIFKISPAGHETSLAIFSSGDIIGEFACLDGEPRSATAIALGRSVVWEMGGDTFLDHLRRQPDLALRMARLLAKKLRWTAAYAETIAQFDAAGRLLHLLLLYNAQFGEELEAGKRYLLDLSLNQTDLASLVGARREWVNRLLREWERRKLLHYRAGKLTILDMPRVQEERDRHLDTSRP
ncbi:MAG: Crp/Fnr family transcriptional regulator [Chloroflexi bacterium]|nr:Crp/Fnr family transcriptional regulator [Chloroflexota bacterium]